MDLMSNFVHWILCQCENKGYDVSGLKTAYSFYGGDESNHTEFLLGRMSPKIQERSENITHMWFDLLCQMGIREECLERFVFGKPVIRPYSSSTAPLWFCTTLMKTYNVKKQPRDPLKHCTISDNFGVACKVDYCCFNYSKALTGDSDVARARGYVETMVRAMVMCFEEFSAFTSPTTRKRQQQQQYKRPSYPPPPPPSSSTTSSSSSSSSYPVFHQAVYSSPYYPTHDPRTVAYVERVNAVANIEDLIAGIILKEDTEAAQ